MIYMRKLQLYTKLKGYFSIAFILFAVLFLASLFIFKDNLTEIASNLVIKNAGSEVISSESAKLTHYITIQKAAYLISTHSLNLVPKGVQPAK